MTLAKGPTSQESGPGPRLQVTIGGRAQRIFSKLMFLVNPVEPWEEFSHGAINKI